MRRALAVLAVALAAPSAAFACACCADRGEWHQLEQKNGQLELGELNRLRWATPARLFQGPGGLEAVKGIATPAPIYSVRLRRVGKSWTFTFRDARNRAGTLAFEVPAVGVQLGADLHDGKLAGGGGPLLYKEWRLAGPVTAKGIFASGARRASFRLILQGRGNNCVNADDFRRWTLQVSGPDARYSLFGTLAKAAS
jgi:hypothetical protein